MSFFICCWYLTSSLSTFPFQIFYSSSANPIQYDSSYALLEESVTKLLFWTHDEITSQLLPSFNFFNPLICLIQGVNKKISPFQNHCNTTSIFTVWISSSHPSVFLMYSKTSFKAFRENFLNQAVHFYREQQVLKSFYYSRIF